MESQLLNPVARPEGNEPPTDRNFDDSYRLDNESLESIGPFRWLDDAVINTFLRSLCLARPGQCVTFDSTVLNALQTTLESEDAASLTPAEVDELFKPFRTLAATVTGNRGLVFMPFCMGDHWILAVADFKSQVIRVYDSLVSCTGTGTIVPSELVHRILVCATGTLSFCIDESQWAVQHMWLPIERNLTECGVYVCLMALQHAHERDFVLDDYNKIYRHVYGHLSRYELEMCYWMAGRRVILEVCRRYFKPVSHETQLRVIQVGWSINKRFRDYYDPPLEEKQTSQFKTFHMARFRTLRCVTDALQWLIDSIGELGSAENLSENESIQNKARNVVLTLAGEPFRNEIVEEAAQYALHDVKALQNLKLDLRLARQALSREFLLAKIRREQSIQPAHVAYVAHAAQEAQTAQTAQLGGPTEEARSVTEHQSPYSPRIE